MVLLTALIYFWKRCPKKWANYCIGKEKCSTLSFQVAVDHDKRIIICSQAFFGAASDKLIIKVVNESRALINGSMKDTQFTLCTEDSNLIVVKAAYLLSDSGFLQIDFFIDPRIKSWASDDIK